MFAIPLPVFTAIELSPEQYRQRIDTHLSLFPLPAIGQHARERKMRGHLSALPAFERTPFVRPGELAALAGVPASTVRHDTTLGLILHDRIKGKHSCGEHGLGSLINVQDCRRWP